MPFTSLRDQLGNLEAAGLLRTRRVLQSPQSAHIQADGRNLISFCSNDYLGLASHPQLIQAVREGAQRYGVGAGASHLLSGHGVAHEQAEAKLAQFAGLPRALLFSTGYMANLGVVTALAGRDSALFSDSLNHASLIDAARLSRAAVHRYAHSDVAALEQELASSSATRKLVMTDAVFSMDGDIAPLPQLLALCERFDAWLLIDDAHGFGVLGEGGRGVLAHFNLRSPRIIYMGTLGKAAGVFGAFVAAEKEVIEILIQRARTYIYTTALPPLLAHVLPVSLKLIESENWRREHLARLIAQLRAQLELQRWRLLPSTTAIQPLVIGANAEALRVGAGLERAGILAPAIRPPSVPEGTARLRISLSAGHTLEDIARLTQALQELEADAHAS
ncbi:MAG: 8-amino-7-oxononanoate synthase [Burkholderiales bacterium]